MRAIMVALVLLAGCESIRLENERKKAVWIEACTREFTLGQCGILYAMQQSNDAAAAAASSAATTSAIAIGIGAGAAASSGRR